MAGEVDQFVLGSREKIWQVTDHRRGNVSRKPQKIVARIKVVPKLSIEVSVIESGNVTKCGA